MVLFLSIAAPIWFVSMNKNSSTSTPAPNVGQPVDSPGDELLSTLSFNDLNGEKFSLKDLRGRVVLVNVWSTVSAASRAEVPTLNGMQESFGRSGLTVIGIATDASNEQVRQFQREVPQQYRVGLQSIGSKISITQLPTTYVIDRKGQVRKKLTGPQSKSTLVSEITPLLSEQP